MQPSLTSSSIAQPMQQAELILKLYELRREAVMRQARGFIGGPFLPSSVDDFVAQVSAGNQQSGFILQVYGYWDMVSAFVIHGALTEPLVYDTCQEMYFQYSKIQPYLAGFREKMNLPEFLRSLEAVVEGSEAGRARVQTMRQNIHTIAEIRAQTSSGNDTG
ncbi:MAG TPA: hypothetical protein VHX63_15910 [Acidobacteriaceae bacterium]|jgi:hypothetical protein|nr:hypothetical protein [Acidobacteriaceae bacterium]